MIWQTGLVSGQDPDQPQINMQGQPDMGTTCSAHPRLAPQATCNKCCLQTLHAARVACLRTWSEPALNLVCRARPIRRRYPVQPTPQTGPAHEQPRPDIPHVLHATQGQGTLSAAGGIAGQMIQLHGPHLCQPWHKIMAARAAAVCLGSHSYGSLLFPCFPSGQTPEQHYILLHATISPFADLPYYSADAVVVQLQSN